MSIFLWTGLPGGGKSLEQAQEMLDVLWRNYKWHEKGNEIRQVVSNQRLAPWVEQIYPGFISYWDDPRELVKVRNADVFWDEIGTHMDATRWKDTPLELKRWLQQHRKFGVDIYATTQDFGMIDISFRRLTERVYKMTKLIGSPDPSPTRPPVKHPWGVCMRQRLKPDAYKVQMDADKSAVYLIPGFTFITPKLVSAFDTTQEIKPGQYPPMQHIERECLTCHQIKVFHA